jgi:hypothetical protein
MPIAYCPSCREHSQDKLHGEKMRVFNYCGKDKSESNMRCTVCGNKKGENANKKKTVQKDK